MPDLDTLREHLAKVEAEMATLGQTNGDPATARLGGQALRQHNDRMDRELRRYCDLNLQANRLRFKIELAEARDREASRVRLTADQVDGWHKVVRVNAKIAEVRK